MRFDVWIGIVILLMCCVSGAPQVVPSNGASDGLNVALLEGKRALRGKQFVAAKEIFSRYRRTHPDDVAGRVGLGDAEVGLRAYAAAEMEYRGAVLTQPMLWAAHRSLVLVEAKLGRWEDFDRERAILRAARERGAAGIDPRDADVIDSFSAGGREWIVREYFEPLGRSQARINFESFSKDGHVLAYVSLERGDALQHVDTSDAVVVGAPSGVIVDEGFALDFYDGRRHGTIVRYATMPRYEAVRATFLTWARRKARTADSFAALRNDNQKNAH